MVSAFYLKTISTVNIHKARLLHNLSNFVGTWPTQIRKETHPFALSLQSVSANKSFIQYFKPQSIL